MISKSHLKLIRSLEIKKYRDLHKLFLVEGTKTVKEYLKNSWNLYALYSTESWANTYAKNINPLYIVDKEELKKVSLQKTPQDVIAIFYQKEYNIPDVSNKLGIALDEVQDAGNAGTITRIALWFGLDYVVFGEGTADPYHPKVIQSSMGALAKIPFIKVKIDKFIDTYLTSSTIYGTFVQGENIYSATLVSKGLIVVGNEGNGISKNVEKRVTHKLYIPPYPEGNAPIDSLNVATATAIVCSEFRRRLLFK